MLTNTLETLIQSKNPTNGSKLWYILEFNNQLAGKITPEVKIQGDCFIPLGSYVCGKCILKDVTIPYNTGIISLSVHKEHDKVGKIGDFELVKDFRIARGVYVSGLIRKSDHEYMNARIILGYDLCVYNRNHTSKQTYKKIQKQKL